MHINPIVSSIPSSYCRRCLARCTGTVTCQRRCGRRMLRCYDGSNGSEERSSHGAYLYTPVHSNRRRTLFFLPKEVLMRRNMMSDAARQCVGAAHIFLERPSTRSAACIVSLEYAQYHRGHIRLDMPRSRTYSLLLFIICAVLVCGGLG